MKRTAARRIAWSVAALSLLTMAAGSAFSLAYVIATRDYLPILSHQALVPALTVTYAILGYLIMVRYPQHRIGWLFGGVGILYGLNALSVGYAAYASVSDPGSRSIGVQLAAWVRSWVWLPALLLPVMFVLLLFPEGRLSSNRWRVVAWAGGLGLVALVFSIMVHPGPLEAFGILEPNPFGLGAARGILDGVINLAWVLLAVGLFGSMAALAVRFRGARGIAREQLKWLVYAVGLMVAGFTLSAVLAAILPAGRIREEIGIGLSALSPLAIAVGATIAIVRHRLYDIDLIINRTLVYGGLSFVVAGIYVLVVVSLGQAFQARGSFALSLLATGIVAVIVLPLRDRLQRGVNRLMYGERDDPYRVLSRLSLRLEATFAPGEVLPTIVETVAQTLKLPYAGIALREGDGFRTVCEFGRPAGETLVLPLTYQGLVIGRLIWARRGPSEQFTAGEERLLADIAHQAGVAVQAVQLTADLQRSRERLVATREEERRRLRRDLHDGLGPRLAAIHVQAASLRRAIRSAPEAAEAMVDELRGEIRDAIDDIRRLVYQLRPPTLDEFGLLGAIRTRADQYHARDGLEVRVMGPDRLPELPAAVEVAAYRIAEEGLTNVVRHSQARRCEVRVSVGHDLELEVVDDGVGLPDQPPPGVGLRSMRERAEELGGTCIIESPGGRGTRVYARIPLPASRT